ncbi:phosphoenolpyruvate-protein phosphotransferase PtsP [Ectothiorhodospiraceae bacterium BW-2]|nr:phosphoenolpyruvate-protein phosphotransferase PtsP [Ectothiorhodospiraceae bacterium BW-2]
MRDSLNQLHLELEAATTLPLALELTVNGLQQLLDVAVCSIYLHDESKHDLVMVATAGLNHHSIGQVRLTLDQGIVGLVAQRAEPIHLTDAPEHARFRFFPEIGEEGLTTFLGVPIIDRRENMGVMTLQQPTGAFSDEVSSQLVTFAAQLARIVTRFNGLEALNLPGGGRLKRRDAAERRHYQAISGAPGVAFGKAVVIDSELDLASVTEQKPGDSATELQRLRQAIDAVDLDLHAMRDNWDELLPEGDRALFDVYSMMLQSSSFAVEMERHIVNQGCGAATAVRNVVASHMELFAQMSDPYLRQRGEDVYELGRRIVEKLQDGTAGAEKHYPRNTILVAREITAAMMAEVPAKRLKGIISLQGSRTSHSAILARALKIPAILGLENLAMNQLSGMEIGMDGASGDLYIKPSTITRKALRVKQQLRQEEQQQFETIRELPAETLDGVRIKLYANSGLMADLDDAISCGAEGIGLYRTEYPFMIQNRFPGEEEQLKIYRKVLQTLAPQPVTMRTLDIGGDKALPYFPIQESNPFLGWRGIRFTLDHPDIFLVQVRAMLRANIGLGNLRILLPMITNLSELDSALMLIQQAYQELQGESKRVELPPLGAMIEVPSAVYQAHCIARKVDFLSIGSNDLTQYLLAVDRNNARVAGLYDSFHPAVIQALAQVVRAANEQRTELSICGEMAGDPDAARLLIGLGIENLSMNASSIPEVKQSIRQTSMAQLREQVERLLDAESASEVASGLQRVLGRQRLY